MISAVSRKTWGAASWYLVLILGAISMVIPLFWMASTSLKETGAVFEYPPKWLPVPAVWHNYVEAWKAVPFGMFYINSIVIAVAQTFGVLLTSSMAAFAFARLHFPGRNKLFVLYLGTLMIPSAVTMIPTFVLMRWLGWINTYEALIIPGIFTAYGTFLLRQFFLGVPTDLEDAARIDGCNKLGIYWNIILPLAKPAMATLGVFTFIGSWNNFMWPLIMANDLEMMTLPIGLAAFQNTYRTDWNLLMAASVMVMIPSILVFLFGQRYFVEGIKLGGIKG
jgi:multiple sugar transport system permease protein